jgi:DNA mismatch repair protein MutS
VGERQDGVSLLWPAGSRPEPRVGQRLTTEAAADLQLAEVSQALVVPGSRPVDRDRRERFARQALAELCTDPRVIAYRHEVVANLLDDPPLRERLAELLPDLEALAETVPHGRYHPLQDRAVQRLAHRLGELELFVDVARRLADALDGARPRAPALQAVHDYVRATTSSPLFRALAAELPALRATLAKVRSVTVGINLTPDLLPESATLLAFGTGRVDGRSGLLGRLFGGGEADRGLTPLRRGATDGQSFAGHPNGLVQDLNKLLQAVAAPVAEALARYASVPTAALARLGPELALLVGGALLVERLRGAGLPMCRPEMLAPDERRSELSELYEPGLALRSPGSRVVTNRAGFDEATARVWILTGPNHSGKTTYTRAVGLAHVLAQAGLYVPARSARLSPVDGIYVHFPSAERPQLDMGRLDDEAQRLAAIFQRATPHSLILLNEALAGTSAVEALGLAQGVVRGLRLLGARAIYVTHLHELAAAIGELNATTPGDGTVGSLIADVVDAGDGPGHTFRIRPGPPGGRSLAAEIAEQHGISYEQLARLLRERGIAAAGVDSGRHRPAGDDP